MRPFIDALYGRTAAVTHDEACVASGLSTDVCGKPHDN